MQLSSNFTLDEFVTSQVALRNKIDNTPDGNVIANLKKLANLVLQPTRDHFGPIVITSGYRSDALNKAVGGSKYSQHILGMACDIVIPGHSLIEVAKWIEKRCTFDQLIYEHKKWIHVSYNEQDNRQETLTASFQRGVLTYEHGLIE